MIFRLVTCGPIRTEMNLGRLYSPDARDINGDKTIIFTWNC